MAGGLAVVRIDDAGDDRIAEYRHLRDADLRRRVEQPDAGPGLFIAEGVLAVRRLVASPYRLRSVLVTPARLRALEADLASVGAPVYVADRAVMRGVAGFDLHRGAVAAGERRPLPRATDLLRTARSVAVLEGINDHENLGVIFRNAAALGIDGILLCPRCCDPLYRRSVRVSVGHVLSVPFSRLAPWPDGLADVRGAGFTVVALTPGAGAEPIDEVAAEAPHRVAIVLGAEGPGLSEGALAAADRRVRIPMAGDVDSLNVGSAAAIAFHRLRTARDQVR